MVVLHTLLGNFLPDVMKLEIMENLDKPGIEFKGIKYVKHKQTVRKY